MKRIIPVLIITVLIFSLCACGGVSPAKESTTESTTKSIYDDGLILDDTISVKYDPKDYKLIGNEFHSVDGSHYYTAEKLTSEEELAAAFKEFNSLKNVEKSFTFPVGKYTGTVSFYKEKGSDTYSGICIVDFAGEFAGEGLYGVKFYGDSKSTDISKVERFGNVIATITVTRE